jgi:hypothetical protein
MEAPPRQSRNRRFAASRSAAHSRFVAGGDRREFASDRSVAESQVDPNHGDLRARMTPVRDSMQTAAGVNSKSPDDNEIPNGEWLRS